MKSRFFSIPGLLVDVSEVIVITCDEKTGYWMIGFRNGVIAREVEMANAKSIQEYIEEYEADQMGAWELIPVNPPSKGPEVGELDFSVPHKTVTTTPLTDAVKQRAVKDAQGKWQLIEAGE